MLRKIVIVLAMALAFGSAAPATTAFARGEAEVRPGGHGSGGGFQMGGGGGHMGGGGGHMGWRRWPYGRRLASDTSTADMTGTADNITGSTGSAMALAPLASCPTMAVPMTIAT